MHRSVAADAGSRLPPIARFAWGLLAYDVAVIAWGAYVRATGSGAGCGRHWPTCNGEIVPRAPRLETVVELSHRVSSGIAFLATMALLVWALRAFPRGHLARRGAATATGLMAAEALIGAGLVLFSLVAKNASLTRALSISLHLVNTFLLLAATSLTAWWASGGSPVRVGSPRVLAATLAAALLGMLLTGATGAVTALGDTLFPAPSLAAGLAQDLAPGAHAFVRLRFLHPLVAAATATTAAVAANLARHLVDKAAVRVLGRVVSVLVVAQVAAGLVDVALRAPVAMQLGHVALADALWISLVLMSAAAFAEQPDTHARSSAAEPPSPGAANGLYL